jgi:hypothetical protein
MSRSNPTTSELTEPSLREERTRRRGARVEAKAEPHPSRLSPAHPYRAEILAAHAAALAADEPGYADPETGLFVLTAGFLARRGTCCGRGCRHCP